MDDRSTQILKAIAVVLGVAFLGWAIYEKFVVDVGPGDMAYHAGSRAFEDGHYERAIEEFQAALTESPEHVHALRGLAISLHKAGHRDEALTIYHEAVRRDPQFGATYANRGILLDTMGRHEAALKDYIKALELAPELADGPHWLTRFLRNQPEAPPTIADRARYLRAELAKPEDERLLRVPEVDRHQRPYQQ